MIKVTSYECLFDRAKHTILRTLLHSLPFPPACEHWTLYCIDDGFPEQAWHVIHIGNTHLRRSVPYPISPIVRCSAEPVRRLASRASNRSQAFQPGVASTRFNCVLEEYFLGASAGRHICAFLALSLKPRSCTLLAIFILHCDLGESLQPENNFFISCLTLDPGRRVLHRTFRARVSLSHSHSDLSSPAQPESSSYTIRPVHTTYALTTPLTAFLDL